MNHLLQPQVFVFFVPIVAIVMVFGTIIAGVYYNYRKKKEMFALYHQERMAAIEKGIELPPLNEDFFHDEGRPHRRSPHGTLLWGLILVLIGMALYVALHATLARTDGTGDPALYALLPIAVGVACLIYYFGVGRKLAATMEEERKARLAEASRARNAA